MSIKQKTLKNNFSYIDIQNKYATAKIALQGAHVFAYQVVDKPVLLWLSDAAYFIEGKAIRGGIPLCFPWFGKHKSDDALPQHGFARTSLWELVLEKELADASCHVQLKLCESSQSLALWDYKFELTLDVYVGEALRVVLSVHNTDRRAFEVGTALHTYFQVSHIDDVRIEGLDDTMYYDALTQSTHTQKGTLSINEETDRVYQTHNDTLSFSDAKYSTSIESKGSASVVVWNPWKEKSQAMADMTNDGYKSMLCLETSNAREDTRWVKPSEVHRLEVKYGQSEI